MKNSIEELKCIRFMSLLKIKNSFGGMSEVFSFVYYADWTIANGYYSSSRRAYFFLFLAINRVTMWVLSTYPKDKC